MAIGLERDAAVRRFLQQRQAVLKPGRDVIAEGGATWKLGG
jgi:hypothetical protein